MSYYNPTRRELHAQLRLTMSAVGRRHVSIRVNGGHPFHVQLDAVQRRLNLAVTLRPGPNAIEIDSAEPAVRLGEGQDQLRTFAVYRNAVGFGSPTLLSGD